MLRWPGAVGVNGTRHRLHVDYPRGAPQNPATRAELGAKFDAVAAPPWRAPAGDG
jgi:2-methylcitrate dehydratase PrpD